MMIARIPAAYTTLYNDTNYHMFQSEN